MITVPVEYPILLVDDDEADRIILQIVLDKSNLQNEAIFLAEGQAAIDFMEAAVNGENPMPALTLLDINMPGLTGFDVLSHIRSKDELQEIPIAVMLSSSDAEADKVRAAELGAYAFLAKPSGLIDFVNLFNEYFTNEPGHQACSPGTASTRLRP